MTDNTSVGSIHTLLESVKESALENVATHGSKLFTVRTKKLPTIVLDGLRGISEQDDVSAEALAFIHTYGSIVVMDEFYKPVPLLWNQEGVPEDYLPIVKKIREEVSEGRIIGAYFSPCEIWEEQSDVEDRFQIDMSIIESYDPEDAQRFSLLSTRYYRFLYHVVTQIDSEHLDKVRELVQLEDSDRELKLELLDSFKGIVREAQEFRDHNNRDNFLWVKARELAVSDYPIDEVNVNDLLDEAMNGDPKLALESFYSNAVEATIMNAIGDSPIEDTPASFQKFVEDNNYQEALNRRYAKLDEVPVIWTPQAPREKNKYEFPDVTTISWKDFRNEVLGRAEKISVVFTSNDAQNMVAVTTASENAKPIFKWDSLELRNQLSWYVLNGPIQRWYIRPDEFYQIKAVSLVPASMHRTDPNLYGAIFYIDKARPYHKAEIGLFDKLLKDDFRPFKSSLREYSSSHKLTNNAEASACGVLVGANNFGIGNTLFVVETARQIRKYIIKK